MASLSASWRLRCWVFLLAVGFTLLGLHLAGSVYLLGPDYGRTGGWLGEFPYPDFLLVALLWAGFAQPPFWALTGVALAVGGWGWGGVRLGGARGGLAGVLLVPALALAPLLPLLPLLGAGGHWPPASGNSLPGLPPPGPGWAVAVGWSWLVPVLGWAAAAGLSPAARRRRDLALFGAAVLATALAAAWLLATLLATLASGLPAGRPHLWVAPALFLVALLPLPALAALAPCRRRVWVLLGLAGGLPLVAVAGAIPVLVPRVATVAAGYEWDPSPPSAQPPGQPWFTVVARLGDGLVAHDSLERWEEGYAGRLVFPDASLPLGGRSGLPDEEALLADRVSLAAGRERLRRLAAWPGAPERVAHSYLAAVTHDPVLAAEDLAFVAGLGELFSHRPGVGAAAAAFLYGRGLAAEADQAAAAAARRLARIDRLLLHAGRCPGRGCREAPVAGGEEVFVPRMRLAGPALGSVTVRFALSRVPGAEAGLFVGLVPLGEGGRGEAGGWPPGPKPAALAKVRGGVAVLGPLPAGRYAVQVGYREGEPSAFGRLSVSGWPTLPLEIGPGEWEKEVLLSVWPDDPLEAWCEDGHLEWAPLPLAGSYLVEGWAQQGRSAVALQFSRPGPGPHLPLDEVVKGHAWPNAGFRVVAVDDFGREAFRFNPITRAGLLRGATKAACQRLAGDDRVGG